MSSAVARAQAAHGAYRERQRLAAKAALGPLDGAAQAAAQVLLRIARAAA